jgi:IS5 family transposase
MAPRVERGVASARQMSFADLELLRQGVRLEPLLQAICDFLDKQPALIERVRRDLVRGLKAPDKGRHGLTAPLVLRALVLMRAGRSNSISSKTRSLANCHLWSVLTDWPA